MTTLVHVACKHLTNDTGRSAIVDLKCTLAKPFSPHGLHAEFTTTAYRNGVPDE